MMRMPLLVAAALVVVSACTAPDRSVAPTTTAASTTSTTSAADTPICQAGELPFVEEGVVAALDSRRRDARAIAEIRRHTFEACERVEIEFLSTTGSPASGIGPVGVSILSDTGIIRISLAEAIGDSAVADTTLNGVFVDGWYVIEGLGDGLVVDLHLAQRAAARAFMTSSPARLIIDLAASRDADAIARPVSDGGIVLMSPQPGVGLYPLKIAGYAAPGINAVRVRLADSSGTVVDRSVSTLSTVHVWQSFEAGLSDGPSGSVDLFVGVVDDEGQEGAGVRIALDLP